MNSMARFKVGDRVTFNVRLTGSKLSGYIARVWDKPVSNPYVTIITDDGCMFVRETSGVCHE